jgi:uncharacterized membrane protein YbaN (DUF454 family)
MKSRIINVILITFGTLFLIIGLIGIIIPILPTTPFLLLAAACYFKSSTKFYNWMMNNKIFGNYIKNYMEKKGIPIKVKLISIIVLWITIIISSLIVSNILIDILLFIIAVAVSIHILLIKTLKE